MKKAFTLAEILITLSIIGVIASMTIPSLVQDVQDAQLKTAWKRAFADISQATMRMVANNGGSLKGTFTSLTEASNQFSKYLNYTKSCAQGASISSAGTKDGCWHSAATGKLLRGISQGGTWTGPGLILNNGNLLTFANISTNCNGPYAMNSCVSISIDVNGFNGPNTWGKDIFVVYIIKNGVIPWGIQGDPYPSATDCTSTGSGYGCGAKYLRE